MMCGLSKITDLFDTSVKETNRAKLIQNMVASLSRRYSNEGDLKLNEMAWSYHAGHD